MRTETPNVRWTRAVPIALFVLVTASMMGCIGFAVRSDSAVYKGLKTQKLAPLVDHTISENLILGLLRFGTPVSINQAIEDMAAEYGCKSLQNVEAVQTKTSYVFLMNRKTTLYARCVGGKAKPKEAPAAAPPSGGEEEEY
ncbi:MAG: hypothetical protein HYY13_00145 [Nitrospirae bacterium]|nr:hypothetical protein [Nitrospirota bacterium]